MAYDEDLDARVRAAAEAWGGERKRMFGGTCYLSNGNMVCGVWKDFLILRLGVERAAEAIAGGKARPFDITGKPMKGWAMVPAAELSPGDAERWIAETKTFVDTLPETKKR